MPTMKQAGRATPSGIAAGMAQAPASSSEDPWRASMWTLRFADPHKEAAYQAYFSAYTTQQRDPVAAAAYLTMIVGGGIFREVCLYLAIIPPDGCSPLMYGSLLAPLSHLLLLAALGSRRYSSQRSAILLGYRAYYLVLTTWTYPYCAIKGGAFTPEMEGPEDETPFSALFWRSGMVGLLYYASAFLLLWQHFLPVQLAFWAAYASRLTRQVCATTTQSKAIARALRAAHAVLGGVVRWVMAAHGALGVMDSSSGRGAVEPGGLLAAAAAAAGVLSPAGGVLNASETLGASSAWLHFSPAAAGASVLAGSSSSSSIAGGGVCLQGVSPAAAPTVSLLGPTLDCPHTLWGLQTLVGLLLPCFCVYVMESRARRQWAKSQYLAIAEASSSRQSSGGLPRNASGSINAGITCSSSRAAVEREGSPSRAGSEGWGGEAGDVWGHHNAPAAAADAGLGPCTPLYCQLYCLGVAAVLAWGALGWVQRQGVWGGVGAAAWGVQ